MDNYIDNQELSVLGFETLNNGINSAIKSHSNFLSNMAYQMRTALNAITGFSEILVGDETHPEHKEYAQEINNASRGLAELVNDVIQFTKLDTESSDNIEKKPVVMSEIFDEVISMNSHKANKKSLELDLVVCDSLPGELYSSQRFLRDIISRLTELTIKFSSDGKVKIRADYSADEQLRVEFKGDNINLDYQKRKDLFEPFSESCEHIYKEIGDTGLGFAIAAKIADILGAAITVSQESTSNTLFTISVPCPQDLHTDKNQQRSRLVDEYIRQRQDDKAERPKIDKERPKILVAEDNTANQTIIKVLLRRKGFDVCVVPDGLEAVAKTISDDFDLVLMDMRMPKMNGMEAIKQIRKEGINIPIIALTALEHNELNDDHTTDLIDGYIPKPIDEHKMDSELSRFIVMPQKVEFN